MAPGFDPQTLRAPFPYFGGKSRACDAVWAALGDVPNYVEPFCGSAAMLLGRPHPPQTETINDADGFIANFWRAVAAAPERVAHHADWPCNEADLEARHGWLVNRAQRLRWCLEDPDFFDAKIAGWWLWGACNWLGDGWCGGKGPHKSDGANISRMADGGQGINRKLPHLGDGGQGINRQLPHLANAGRGINAGIARADDERLDEHPRTRFIREWMQRLCLRLRGVRVACGDWSRVVRPSVTDIHGLTGLFLDPPYSAGNMDYAAGGVGGELAWQVRQWCAQNGDNPRLRIVLCGHEGEHDALLSKGWAAQGWRARKGYAQTAEARANTNSETLYLSPHCIDTTRQQPLFEALPA